MVQRLVAPVRFGDIDTRFRETVCLHSEQVGTCQLGNDRLLGGEDPGNLPENPEVCSSRIRASVIVYVRAHMSVREQIAATTVSILQNGRMRREKVIQPY